MPRKYSQQLSQELRLGSTASTLSSAAGLNNSGQLWGREASMQLYRTAAQSLENRRRPFTETVGMSAYEYLQKLSFVKQRHHPENPYCAQSSTLLKKRTAHRERDSHGGSGCCHGEKHCQTAPQIVR